MPYLKYKPVSRYGVRLWLIEYHQLSKQIYRTAFGWPFPAGDWPRHAAMAIIVFKVNKKIKYNLI